MVRVFIKNGPCGAEIFFKLIGNKNSCCILRECIKKHSVTFSELQNENKEIMNKGTLSKQLAELVNAGLLDKIRFIDEKSPRVIYRTTQKAINLEPILESIQDFHRHWVGVEGEVVADWIDYTKRLLGRKWNARIIWILFVLRSVRFNELKSSIEGISFKMLAQQLHYLEDEGVICRKDFNENPPHIEYSLTDKGDALYEILLLIAQWNSQYGMKNGNMGTMSNIV